MHSFVIMTPFKSANTVVERRIGTIRTVAFFGSIVGILAVVAVAAVSTSMPEEKWLVAVVGGTLAAAPFVIARALEEVVRERRSA